MKTVNYSTENGLPSSQVYDIIQDDYGYLWFSTDKGLSRYNGYEFTNYDKEDGLADDVIFDFHKRPNGVIWCTTSSGALFKIKGEIPTFEPYQYNDSLVNYTDNQVTQCVLFDEDRIFIKYHNWEGFLAIEQDGTFSIEPRRIRTNTRESPENARIVVLHDPNNEPFFYLEEKNEYTDKIKDHIAYSYLDYAYLKSYKFEAVAISTNQAVFGIRNKKSNRLIWKNGTKVQSKSVQRKVIASGFLEKGKIWMGYHYGGVEIYNTKGEVIKRYCEGKSVTQCYIDHQQNIWVSTLNDGVYKIVDNGIQLVNGSKNRKTTAVESDHLGNVYFGYDDGSVDVRSAGGAHVPLHKPKEAHVGASVQLRFNASNKQLYFISDGIFALDPQTQQYECLLEDKRSNYLEIDENSPVFGMAHVGILKEKEHVLWILKDLRCNDVFKWKGKIYGGNNKGLYVSGYPDSKVSQLIVPEIRVDDLNAMDGFLVLGTHNKGVILLDENHKKSIQLTKRDGLNSNFVARTYTENDSTLWIGSNEGINRIRFFKDGAYEIRDIKVSDGLVSGEIWDLLVLNDTVWVGTQKGVNFFPIDLIQTPKQKKTNYHVRLTRILLNGEALKKSSTHFNHKQNEIQFDFEGISFREELVYRYKLKGGQTKWYYTKNRSCIFSNLAPGDYIFIVQTKLASHESWNDNQLRYSFTISQPFWTTWWFYGGSLTLLGLLVYLFFKVRVFTYNKDIVREIMRLVLKRIRRTQPSIKINHQGKEATVLTNKIHYLKTDGNYLEIYTEEKKYVIRSTFKQFTDRLPDQIEFLQVHRSYIVRIDKIQEKGKHELILLNRTIPVSRKHWKEIQDL